MNWKKYFENGKELVLATSSKDGKPNANTVISLGFCEGKLLIADCSMDTTIKNLMDTNRVSTSFQLVVQGVKNFYTTIGHRQMACYYRSF